MHQGAISRSGHALASEHIVSAIATMRRYNRIRTPYFQDLLKQARRQSMNPQPVRDIVRRPGNPFLRYVGGAALQATDEPLHPTDCSAGEVTVMSTAIAKNHMAEMNMLGMLAVLDKTLADATRDKISYSEFVDILLQAEADYRQERKTVNRIKAAKFTVRPAFEDFDFTAKRSITKAEIKEIYTLGWLNDARPLLLIGETGVGKTFIAQAVGLHACASGKSVLYMSITALQENLAIARSSGAYLRYRAKLAKFDLIIFDEMGMRKFTATEAQDLCEIIEERSIDKSIAFTSQLPVDHWNEVIPDTVIFDAIRDRLEHSALTVNITVNITGDTYRGVKARKLASKKKDA
ncbi:MAG: IS21-like element helper ATPase IstB [Steroidobacteraceae bacterium]